MACTFQSCMATVVLASYYLRHAGLHFVMQGGRQMWKKRMERGLKDLAGKIPIRADLSCNPSGTHMVPHLDFGYFIKGYPGAGKTYYRFACMWVGHLLRCLLTWEQLLGRNRCHWQLSIDGSDYDEQRRLTLLGQTGSTVTSFNILTPTTYRTLNETRTTK